MSISKTTKFNSKNTVLQRETNMYSEYEIRTIPLSMKSWRKKVENFLEINGLRLDDVDYYAGIFRLEEYDILAAGGLKGNLIKCIAVNPDLKGSQLSNRLISHLISIAMSEQYKQEHNNFSTIRVFTKPENKEIFTSLGFTPLATAPKAILLENNLNELNTYLDYLRNNLRQGTNGCIVMNCNPFTLGHKYLIETTKSKVDNLYIIPVKENLSVFTYLERKEMIRKGVEQMENVFVLEGSDYAISQTTFPTYFIKNLDDVSDTYITLDLDIFAKFIAKNLNIKYRFVGSEPFDKLTKRYNELMQEILPKNDIQVIEIKRLEEKSQTISASKVRQHIKEKQLSEIKDLVPSSTLPYILTQLAINALQEELDTTPKPGLVDKHDSGAHKDMDYDLMNKSIKSLREYFDKLSLLGFQNELPSIKDIQTIGLEAEKSMLMATNGVNTHKGALFSMGLTLLCASNLLFNKAKIDAKDLQSLIIKVAKQFPQPTGTHGDKVLKENKIKGALGCAIEGYNDLFGVWLPFFSANKDETYVLHRLLLLIMSTLDDTNIYYRKGATAIERVKKEAGEMVSDFSIDKLERLNNEYINANISPGGSADMLSLTIFVYSILN